MSDKKLIKKLLKASGLIHKANTSGFGNYMVASSALANIMNKLSRQEKRKEKIKKIIDYDSQSNEL